MVILSLVLQLHLGVNSGATKFAIERQAINEATFRCPDELGWQPQVDVLLPSMKKEIILSFCCRKLLVILNDCLGYFIYNQKGE